MKRTRAGKVFALLSVAAMSIATAQEVPCDTDCEGGADGVTCGFAPPETYGPWGYTLTETQICYRRNIYMVKTCVNQQGQVVSQNVALWGESAVWCMPL
jgi:hypothetical protein